MVFFGYSEQMDIGVQQEREAQKWVEEEKIQMYQ